MRLWRGLSKRIVVASVGCGLLGLVSSDLLGAMAMRDVVLRSTVPVWVYAWQAHERAQCEASPATWTQAELEGTRSWAYDAATRVSRNPSAPPIDADLLARVPPGGDRAVRMNGLLRGGAAIYVGPEGGPCGLVVTTWTRRVSYRDALEALLAMAVLAAGLAAALGVLGVVRPLTVRIARLSRAADRVGDPGAYRSAQEPPTLEPDELGHLGASLDRAHARIVTDAATLEKRQSDLRRHLDDVMHDLRTPIASLVLALEEGTDAATDPAHRRLLHGALMDAVYLGALTANLRLASQLREGWSPAVDGARVDLADTVERAATRARILARRSGIALEVAVPDGRVLARCDGVAAEQAIGNVIENAVAYGHAGGHVAVVLERDGARFALRVEDDGPGVADVDLPRLGERTFRSDEARARDPRGSGLGLAITTEVCERCGWSLRFVRGDERGLTVTIEGAVAGELLRA